MPRKLENILLLGATGTIGVHISKAFAASTSSFKRVAILTSQKTLDTKASLMSELKQSGIETIVGDITDESSLKSIFAGMSPQFQADDGIRCTYSFSRLRYHHISAWSDSTSLTAEYHNRCIFFKSSSSLLSL